MWRSRSTSKPANPPKIRCLSSREWQPATKPLVESELVLAGATTHRWARNMKIKRVIVFMLSFILGAACAAEMWLAARNIYTTAPVRISPSKIHVIDQYEQWLGPSRGNNKATITIATLDNKRAIIVGRIGSDGWVLPSIHPERFRSAIKEGDESTAVLQFYRFHPYIRLSVGGTICALLLAFCAFICVGCIRSRKI